MAGHDPTSLSHAHHPHRRGLVVSCWPAAGGVTTSGADERTAATPWQPVAKPPRNPIREDSPAAESSPAEELRSTAEQASDHRINGPFVSDHRRYIGKLSPRALRQ
jgi:hypothetical protein